MTNDDVAAVAKAIRQAGDYDDMAVKAMREMLARMRKPSDAMLKAALHSRSRGFIWRAMLDQYAKDAGVETGANDQ